MSQDLVGKRCGALVVLVKLSKNLWSCVCDCGVLCERSTFLLAKSKFPPNCGKHKGKTPRYTKDSYHSGENNLTGKKFDSLTVLGLSNQYQGKTILWYCVCDCGETRLVPTNDLNKGRTKFCSTACKLYVRPVPVGADRKRSKTYKLRLDLTGKRFGIVTVIRDSSQRTPKSSNVVWDCECDCGTKFQATCLILQSEKKHVTSCGCTYGRNRRIKTYKLHGLRTLAEYGIWGGMVQRCTNPKNPGYKYYGGRGITICERWRLSFQNFFSDMGFRPSENHSLDRKDNNGNYEPGNCRWATQSEQNANRRSKEEMLSFYANMAKPVVPCVEEPSTVEELLAPPPVVMPFKRKKQS